jgi:ABC-type antimicrobial peptide transport system permease subunit
MQSRKEIGIRMALDAAPRQLRNLVAVRGLLMASAGGVIEVATAFGVTRLLANLLFGVEPWARWCLRGSVFPQSEPHNWT